MRPVVDREPDDVAPSAQRSSDPRQCRWSRTTSDGGMNASERWPTTMARFGSRGGGWRSTRTASSASTRRARAASSEPASFTRTGQATDPVIACSVRTGTGDSGAPRGTAAIEKSESAAANAVITPPWLSPVAPTSCPSSWNVWSNATASSTVAVFIAN